MKNLKSARKFLTNVGILFYFIFSPSLADNVVLNVNVQKPVAVTSEKFLSLTLDPAAFLTSDSLSIHVEMTTNMAKALSPAYVRLAGPSSNVQVFQKSLLSKESHIAHDYTFTEAHWILIHQWAEKAGLDVVACIAPQSASNPQFWNSNNTEEILLFNDQMGYNASWQFGYECQTRCNIPAEDLGRDIIRLRNMLDAFPRYSNSIIAGPDVVAFKTEQQQQFLHDYLNASGSALSAITWHPNFASIAVSTDRLLIYPETLDIEKEELDKIIKHLAPDKPLWIAESQPENCKTNFLGALLWTRRLGTAARLGIQVLMRQPEDSIFIPTPDYWVSVLHKKLVGPEVLDMIIITENRADINLFCQCTKPSEKYKKGSMTIFGINLGATDVNIHLQGLKIETLHEYMLTPGFDNFTRLFSKNILLNNKTLFLEDNKYLPEINPIILQNENGTNLKLMPGSIGFWVIPDVKIPACIDHNVDKSQVKKLSMKTEVLESERCKEEESSKMDGTLKDLMNRGVASTNEQKNWQDEKEKPNMNGTDFQNEPERHENLFNIERTVSDERKQRDVKSHLEYSAEEKNLGNDNSTRNNKPVYQPKVNYELQLEEIRAQLEEYKQQLSQYEKWKKTTEGTRAALNEKNHKYQLTIEELNEMETKGIVDEMTLINEVEKVLKGISNNVNAEKITLGGNLERTTINHEDQNINNESQKAKNELNPLYALSHKRNERRTRDVFHQKAMLKDKINSDIKIGVDSPKLKRRKTTFLKNLVKNIDSMKLKINKKIGRKENKRIRREDQPIFNYKNVNESNKCFKLNHSKRQNDASKYEKSTEMKNLNFVEFLAGSKNRYDSKLIRKVDDLNSIFNKEMVLEDNNNLNDCQCRVIRTNLKFKNYKESDRFHLNDKSRKLTNLNRHRRKRNTEVKNKNDDVKENPKERETYIMKINQSSVDTSFLKGLQASLFPNEEVHESRDGSNSDETSGFFISTNTPTAAESTCLNELRNSTTGIEKFETTTSFISTNSPAVDRSAISNKEVQNIKSEMQTVEASTISNKYVSPSVTSLTSVGLAIPHQLHKLNSNIGSYTTAVTERIVQVIDKSMQENVEQFENVPKEMEIHSQETMTTPSVGEMQSAYQKVNILSDINGQVESNREIEYKRPSRKIGSRNVFSLKDFKNEPTCPAETTTKLYIGNNAIVPNSPNVVQFYSENPIQKTTFALTTDTTPFNQETSKFSSVYNDSTHTISSNIDRNVDANFTKDSVTFQAPDVVQFHSQIRSSVPIQNNSPRSVSPNTDKSTIENFGKKNFSIAKVVDAAQLNPEILSTSATYNDPFYLTTSNVSNNTGANYYETNSTVSHFPTAVQHRPQVLNGVSIPSEITGSLLTSNTSEINSENLKKNNVPSMLLSNVTHFQSNLPANFPLRSKHTSSVGSNVKERITENNKTIAKDQQNDEYVTQDFAVRRQPLESGLEKDIVFVPTINNYNNPNFKIPIDKVNPMVSKNTIVPVTEIKRTINSNGNKTKIKRKSENDSTRLQALLTAAKKNENNWSREIPSNPLLTDNEKLLNYQKKRLMQLEQLREKLQARRTELIQCYLQEYKSMKRRNASHLKRRLLKRDVTEGTNKLDIPRNKIDSVTPYKSVEHNAMGIVAQKHRHIHETGRQSMLSEKRFKYYEYYPILRYIIKQELKRRSDNSDSIQKNKKSNSKSEAKKPGYLTFSKRRDKNMVSLPDRVKRFCEQTQSKNNITKRDVSSIRGRRDLNGVTKGKNVTAKYNDSNYLNSKKAGNETVVEKTKIFKKDLDSYYKQIRKNGSADSKVFYHISKRTSANNHPQLSNWNSRYMPKKKKTNKEYWYNYAPLAERSGIGLPITMGRDSNFARKRREAESENGKVNDMNKFWSSLIKMKEDEELLNEYIRQKQEVIDKLKYTRQLSEESSKDYITIGKIEDVNHQGLRALFAQTAPKIEAVITSGLRTAQHLTGSVEELIENFDEKFNESLHTELTKRTDDFTDEATGQEESYNILETVILNVKKFFILLSSLNSILNRN